MSKVSDWAWCPVLEYPINEVHGHTPAAKKLCNNTQHLSLLLGPHTRRSKASCCEHERPPLSQARRNYDLYTCADCGQTWEWVIDEAYGATWWPVNA